MRPNGAPLTTTAPPATYPRGDVMNYWREFGRSLRCFFDWPMLWTRVYCTSALVFFGVQLDAIRATNSDTILHRGMADGYQWGGLAVIAFYVAPKVFEAIVQWRMGKQQDVQPNNKV